MPLTVDDLRSRFGAVVNDEAFAQLLAEAAEREGGEPAVEVFEQVRSELLQVSRPAAVAAVTERRESGDAPVDLTEADWGLAVGGQQLRRLDTGPNPAAYWGDEVEVRYGSALSPEERDARTLALVADAVGVVEEDRA